jgi:GNAT superfamily N-acetyltransferase
MIARAYLAEARAQPDWRITCFFVDKHHRRQGVSSAALGGALELIAGLGGGTVESSLELFERHGFERVRKLRKHHWLVTRTVGRSG